MPALFRPTYTDQTTGNRKRLRKWYAKVRFADGSLHRVPLSPNKQAAELMLGRMLADIEREKAGVHDPFTKHRKTTLSDHLVDWESSLSSGDAGDKHVRASLAAVRKIFEGCGAVFFTDLSGSAVKNYLSALQEPTTPPALDPAKLWYTRDELARVLGIDKSGIPKLVKRHRISDTGNGRARRYPKAGAEQLLASKHAGMSTKTTNLYLAAVKQFAAWMVSDRRAADNPLTHLAGGNAENDRRTEFATLTAEEIARLIDAARTSAAEFRGLSGGDRAALYLTATYTAYRPVELARLIAADFLLTLPTPLVRLDGTRTKNGKVAEQPLPNDVADVLRPFLADRPPHAAVWPGTWFEKAADMIRVDIPAAGRPFVKPGPGGTERVVSFYSLRHSAGLFAEQGGATLREVMTLMRHSDPKLTLKTYGRMQLGQLGAAVEKMPSVLAAPHVPKHVPAGGSGGGSGRTIEEVGETTAVGGTGEEGLDLLAFEGNREALRTRESAPFTEHFSNRVSRYGVSLGVLTRHQTG